MSRRLGAAALGWAALACASLHSPAPAPLVAQAPFVPGEAELGGFQIEWSGRGWHDAALRVRHRDRGRQPLWESLPGRSFVGAARVETRVEETRGSFHFDERVGEECRRHSVERFETALDQVRISGALVCESGPVPFELVFSAPGRRQLRFALRLADASLDRARLVFASDPEERIFGFGVQFSHFDLKGRRVPIWVREQGIGRGLQPLSWLVDRVAASAGAWHTSYAPAPHMLTSRLRSLFLENSEYSVFDLREPDAVTIEVAASRVAGRILYGRSPLELIEGYSAYSGRMAELPAWLQRGAVVGIQGGSQRVREVVRRLESEGAPLAAVWLQDWVGRRDTSFGQQLWWSWQLDRELYPGWEALLAELGQRGIRVLGYVNPFLVDTGERPGRRDLLAEARERGFLVKRPDGSPYFTTITSFDAALVDLSNPRARDWLVAVIREELIGAGLSGWMADFGEALPWDAVLAEGEAPAFHNRYPEAWAALNRRAVEEAGEGEAVFFMRSGFTRSPGLASLFWLGDQLVSWDEHDGIKSAVTGLLSGGLSGFALNHSDLGGYTTLVTPLYGIRRSKELLWRWIEVGAFQVVYRTHEGNLPVENQQIDSDPETLRHFSRFAKLHAAWGFYREALMADAARSGAPVVRHPWLHFPDEPWTRAVRFEEFLVGRELLVAPVLDPGRRRVELWLPPGRWVHLWSGRVFGEPGRSVRIRVAAPLGEPAVFWPEGSAVGERFRTNLERLGVLEAGQPSR